MKHAPTALLFALGVLAPGCDRRPVPPSPLPPAGPAPAAVPPPVESPASVPEAPKPPPAPRHKVTFQVQSETWREGEKPFDIGTAVRESMKSASVDIVGADDAGSEGMVLVTYKETKGESYSSFGLGGPSLGNGTSIAFDLTVLSPKGDVLLRLDRSCGTPSSVSGNRGLYEAALESLKGQAAYKSAGTWVLASLGEGAALSRLLPALADKDEREAVLGLAERLKFDPEDPANRAWLALGREDFAGLVRMGAPAVEPLMAFLAKYWWPEDCAKAAAALAEIGDRRAAKLVVERAIAVGSQNGDPDDLPHILSLMESAGRLGDAFGIAPLEEFARRKPNDVFGRPVPQALEAAAKAVTAIRARLNAGKK
jgi:hypothetical protein